MFLFIPNIEKPDNRPIALVLFPKEDHNNAFEHNQIEELMDHGYRVLCFEAGSAEDVSAIIFAPSDDFFATNPPARQVVAVAALPRGASVEISLVAMRSENP